MEFILIIIYINEDYCNNEEDNYNDIDVKNLSDHTDEDNADDNIDDNNQKVDDILNIDCIFYHNINIKDINAKRTALNMLLQTNYEISFNFY